MKRVLKKSSDTEGISYGVVKKKIEQNIPVGRMGDPDDFALIAVWLLSSYSGYVTGQTIIPPVINTTS
ncbi:MAG: SDR family oxidoreductase [Chloroflexi bacterium]|nr:SDR family oxidoreductase [Chloroflexota bacterium]